MFDYPVEKIDLVFRNGKLIFILAELEKWNKPTIIDKYPDLKKSLDKYEILNEDFNLLFGNPSHIDTEAKAGEGEISWQTTNTILWTRYKYLGLANGFGVDVGIADMGYFSDKVKSGF